MKKPIKKKENIKIVYPDIVWSISVIFKGARRLCSTYSMTRQDAIIYHCKLKKSTWEECRKNGDRAVKVRFEVIG